MSDAKFELIDKNVAWSPSYHCSKKFRKPYARNARG